MLSTTVRTRFSRLLVLILISPVVALPAAAFEEPAAGQAAFVGQKCNMCHSVPQVNIESKVKSEKMKGPDLPNESREAEWIVSFLKREIQLDDKDHKKEIKDADQELQAIAAWLVALDKDG